nr:MAG TPA: hypothetical protein [Caudoviricetes sp.]
MNWLCNNLIQSCAKPWKQGRSRDYLIREYVIW